jgi:hypothetical protein
LATNRGFFTDEKVGGDPPTFCGEVLVSSPFNDRRRALPGRFTDWERPIVPCTDIDCARSLRSLPARFVDDIPPAAGCNGGVDNGDVIDGVDGVDGVAGADVRVAMGDPASPFCPLPSSPSLLSIDKSGLSARGAAVDADGGVGGATLGSAGGGAERGNGGIGDDGIGGPFTSAFTDMAIGDAIVGAPLVGVSLVVVGTVECLMAVGDTGCEPASASSSAAKSKSSIAFNNDEERACDAPRT